MLKIKQDVLLGVCREGVQTVCDKHRAYSSWRSASITKTAVQSPSFIGAVNVSSRFSKSYTDRKVTNILLSPIILTPIARRDAKFLAATFKVLAVQGLVIGSQVFLK
jgi:hypothetical protein